MMMEDKNALNDIELRQVNGGFISRMENGRYGVYDERGNLIGQYNKKKDAVEAAKRCNVSTRELTQEEIRLLQDMYR